MKIITATHLPIRRLEAIRKHWEKQFHETELVKGLDGIYYLIITPLIEVTKR